MSSVSVSASAETTITPKVPKFFSIQHTPPPSPTQHHPHAISTFSLVSYNILAQAYVKNFYFPHSPSHCLSWKARSQAVLTVLKKLGADFLCLQEVDEYESFYKGNMERNGYSSIYIQRGGYRRDGCGIFFKHDRAELILQEDIDYNDLVNSIQNENLLINDEQNDKKAPETRDAEVKSGSTLKGISQDRGGPNDPRVRLKRDCVGIMAAFRLKHSHNPIVIVATTHLYWDPAWADVKLAQAKYLVSRLAQFKALVSNIFNCASSLILTGDFNSVPGDKVYQYLSSCNESSSSETVQNDRENVPIRLCSVYNITKGEPKFTNCTPKFTNTLDYIFFSPSDSIKPVSLLELPESDSYDVVGGLPNSSHPSDHLPIGAEFEISTPQEVQYMLQSHDISTPSANIATQMRHSLNLNSGPSGTSSGRGFFTPSRGFFTPGRGRGRGGRNNIMLVCQLCNRPGHIASHCYHRFDISLQGQYNSNPNNNFAPNTHTPFGSQFQNTNQQAFFTFFGDSLPNNAWYIGMVHRQRGNQPHNN
ncbi:carbon catabolite repressor protein 4 homolog 4-like [Humulus lupulus]|uniref:carbon catabolite repressor protein 4 homolog 4-like n=1 Tax=Humulus lupulus TaxID=3486 RepID=UPI002B405728|nr:carbon catabolite repressor protein 4 homolog 4-like [Humulus lupulus]XP_062077071.1 carbon catabolite repressor protein 4 homolog 4-like [Humulus lupulus]